MNPVPMSDDALEVMLKEYDTLRDEIKERLKIGFSHIAYLGAIVAFAIPAADKISTWPSILPMSLAFAGVLLLGTVALLNMRWVQHCGKHIQSIEKRINDHYGCTVLGWETYAGKVQGSHWWMIPRSPSDPTI